jgi:lipopolysaccharide export system permease protein
VRHLIVRFFILTLGILSLVYLITFVEMMRKTNNTHMSLVDMLYFSFSQLPPVIDKIFPFLILLSSLWSIFSLLKTSELIILKASSVSLWTIARIYYVASFALAMMYVFAIMPLLADLHHDYRDWENNQIRILRNIHKKILTPDDQIIFLNAETFDIPHHTLSNVSLSFLDNDYLLQKIYYAPSGLYNETNKTIFFDKIILLKTNTIVLEAEKTITDFNFTVNLGDAQYDTLKQEITSIYEYPLLITSQKEQKLSVSSLYILFYSLLILPLTCGIYSFIGIASVPTLYRGFKNIKNIMVALFGGLLFYILDSWIMVIAGNGVLPLLMAIITIKIPIILFCVVIIFNKEYGFTHK